MAAVAGFVDTVAGVNVERPKIGIVGGSGHAAGALCALYIAEAAGRAGARTDAAHPDVLLSNTANPHIDAGGHVTDRELAAAHVNASLDWLADAGATIGVVACTAAHTLGWEWPDTMTGVDVIDAACRAALARTRPGDKIAVIAEAATVAAGVYTAGLADREVVYETAGPLVGDAIAARANQSLYLSTIRRLRRDGCTLVIGGCTELAVHRIPGLPGVIDSLEVAAHAAWSAWRRAAHDPR